MASPWKTLDPVETCNLQEIMHEEFARTLQEEENAKFNGLQQASIDVALSDQLKIDVKRKTEPDRQSQLIDVPEDVLNVIRNDKDLCKSVDFCDSDLLLAEMLQAEFDKEHDDEIHRIERKTNKDSKVSVSFTKYLRQNPANDVSSDEDDDDMEPRKEWDRFDSNEKKLRSMNKKGFTHNENGVLITKHDAALNGVRNACRVMSFPPEVHTGDTAAFDVSLSNTVFNQLKTFSTKSSKHKAQDRIENKATSDLAFDEPTRLVLYKFISNEIIERYGGIISTGKEAVILHAESSPNYQGEIVLPAECGIKVFKTTLNEFKQRDVFIKDDYRFRDRFNKQNSRKVIYMWAEKEERNLRRMQNFGVNCPTIIARKKNVIVMSFIGVNQIPAPKLKEADLNATKMTSAYHEVVGVMHRLYNDVKLVHGDLSEYNILWHNNQCYFIDVAQSVEPSHASALQFLMCDCDRISNFFTQQGVDDVKTKEELFTHITGLDPSSLLERVYEKGPSVSMATAHNFDEYPEEHRPLAYPFEYAWSKAQQEKESKANDDNDNDDESDDENADGEHDANEENDKKPTSAV